MDYELIDQRQAKLLKLDIKVSNELVDALSLIIHESESYKHGSKLCKRLKKEIHRQQFEIPIQAVIGNKVIARETVKAFRKNVIAKCYGGDISRKRKLLEKQKGGKKRRKRLWERYTYENPLNRIHGLLIYDQRPGPQELNQDERAISIEVIGSNPYASVNGLKAIGSYLLLYIVQLNILIIYMVNILVLFVLQNF